jgi:uncharacterized protein (TIGR02001 family)
MYKLALTAIVSLTVSVSAIAQTPAAPASAHTFTGNAGVYSDYRFRGISQTYRKPAFQGGFDYAHASGFYLGNWNSNVSGFSYPAGAGLEMDFYGGFKKSFGDVNLDVGYLYYYYPGARIDTGRGTRRFDNQELYVSAGWKFITAKVNYSLSPYFGLDGALATSGYWADRSNGGAALADRGSSRGSLYYDLTLNYEVIPKLTLIGHVGYTDVRKYNELDYADFKLGATYDLNSWVFGAAFITTNAKKQWYYASDARGHIRETGKPTVVLSLSKTF